MTGQGALHLAARRWWDGGGGVPGTVLRALAAPAEWLYRQGVMVRNRRWDARGGIRVEGARVVSVGNLTVGGTGKTPVAAWVACKLLEMGQGCAVVVRGAGRDEVLLHRRWNPRVPVVVDPDRVSGTAAAVAQGCRVVVLDDGFQHRRLARDIDLVLLAAEDPFPGRLLPRGPCREPAEGLARAHAVVVTRRVATREAATVLADTVAARHPHLRVARAALVDAVWQDLAGAAAPAPEGPTLAVASVARPLAFARQVEAETGAPVTLAPFPDHHEFTRRDVQAMRRKAGERTVVVTEKDAVKLSPYQADLEPVRVLAQTLRWEAGEDAVMELLAALPDRRP